MFSEKNFYWLTPIGTTTSLIVYLATIVKKTISLIDREKLKNNMDAKMKLYHRLNNLLFLNKASSSKFKNV